MIVEYSLSIDGYSTITGDITVRNKKPGAALERYDSYPEPPGIEDPDGAGERAGELSPSGLRRP